MADNDDIQEANRRIKEADENHASILSLNRLIGVTSLSYLNLADLTHIQELNLSGTSISDLSELQSMSRLEVLSIDDGFVAKISCWDSRYESSVIV